jgi:hypothetical protein
VAPVSPSDENAELLDQSTKWVPCDVCGQAVPSHWLMGQHLETLKPLLGIKASCMVCGKLFTEHRALRQHLNFCRLQTAEIPPEVLERMKRLLKKAGKRAGSGEQGP